MPQARLGVGCAGIVGKPHLGPQVLQALLGHGDAARECTACGRGVQRGPAHHLGPEVIHHARLNRRCGAGIGAADRHAGRDFKLIQCINKVCGGLGRCEGGRWQLRQRNHLIAQPGAEPVRGEAEGIGGGSGVLLDLRIALQIAKGQRIIGHIQRLAKRGVGAVFVAQHMAQRDPVVIHGDTGQRHGHAVGIWDGRNGGVGGPAADGAAFDLHQRHIQRIVDVIGGGAVDHDIAAGLAGQKGNNLVHGGVLIGGDGADLGGRSAAHGAGQRDIGTHRHADHQPRLRGRRGVPRPIGNGARKPRARRCRNGLFVAQRQGGGRDLRHGGPAFL